MIRNKKGAALLEAIVAIALFAVVASAAIGMMYSGASSSKQGSEYVVAGGLLQEGIEAVRSIRWREFSEIVNGTHGLTTSSGYFEFSGTSESLLDGIYTRTITIEDVLRDGSGDIAGTGSVDSDSKRVTVNVTWETLQGKIQNIDAVFYVFNFNFINTWVQTTLADFALGSLNGSATQATSNGEVRLANIDGAWSSMTSEHQVDLDGNGDPTGAYYEPIQDVLYTLALNTADHELTKWDVSDVSSSAPTKLDGYDTGGSNANDFVIDGGYGFIATDDTSSEVHVVRLSDMTSVNSIDIENTAPASSIVVTGTELIVAREASSDEELYFYDISTPEGVITETGSLELGEECNDLASDGSYVYCANANNTEEIIVVRLSDDTEVHSENLSAGGDAHSLFLDGSNLYVGREDIGADPNFLVLDISTPESSLTVLDSLDTDSSIYAIDVDDGEDFAYLATSDGSQELTVIDLSTFTESATGDTTGTDVGGGVAQFGAHVYILTATSTGELEVFTTESGGWSVPSLIGSHNKSGNHDATAIDVDGNFAYLGTFSQGGDDELFIYDISTPSSPVLLGSFDVGADVNDIAASGNYIYLATDANNRELDVIDVTTKSSPSRAGSYNLTGNQDAFTVDVSGLSVYLGRDQGGGIGRDEFVIFDVSTPGSPSVTGSLNYSDDINDVVVEGTEVYAATDNNSAELVVINVAVPILPVILASGNASGSADAEAVAISGDTVAIGRASSSDPEFHLFDVSTPALPTELGSADVGDVVRSLSFDGSNGLVLGTDDSTVEFQYWDISTPASPSQTSTFDTGGDANSLYFNGTHAFVASESNSLELQVIGEGGAPTDYALDGTFTSQAFDAASSGTSWTQIDWSSSGTGSLEFRIRTASSEAGLDSAIWVGSDGTEGTSYTTSGAAITTDPGASGTQWVQWKVYLSGNGASTPILEDVTLSYQE